MSRQDALVTAARFELVAAALRVAHLELVNSESHPNIDAELEAADARLVQTATEFLSVLAVVSASRSAAATRHPCAVAGPPNLSVVHPVTPDGGGDDVKPEEGR